MRTSIVKERMPGATGVPGVYVGLDDLVRLQYKARGFTFLPRQPIHSLLAGRHASRIRGRGFDFEEIRRYLPGDDIRSIDWKVTARTRKTHTRVFTEERDRPGLLVVDQRMSMFYGTVRSLKSYAAAELAALAAWRTVSVGDRVGGLVFDDSDIVEIRPNRSRATVMRLLRAVVEKNRALRADADVATRPAMLNEVLDRALRLSKHDHLVTVISDFDGVDDDTRGLVIRLSQHNDVLFLLVHDPSATDLPHEGRLVVSSGELQVELDLAEGKTHRAMQEFSNQRMATVLDWQKQLGIPVVPVDTGSDVAEQVRRLLGQARQSGRR